VLALIRVLRFRDSAKGAMSLISKLLASFRPRAATSVYVVEGIIGVVSVIMATIVLRAEPAAVVHALGSPAAPIVIGMALVVGAALALLRFELSERVFVSLTIVACIAFFPLLGTVLTTWAAVFSAGLPRAVAAVRAGRARAREEWLNAFRIFATYGIPVIAAGVLYKALGGTFPPQSASLETVGRIIVCGIVLIAANLAIMVPIMIAYGYSAAQQRDLALSDASISLLALPYAICMTLSWVQMGWSVTLALAFTGVLINLVANRLASARGQTRRQLQRLASLSQVGKTVSLNFPTDELLMTIYTECRKVVDATFFTIALYDETTNELAFELDMHEGVEAPKGRMPLGEGLNSWVVQHREPLLLGGVKDERRLGLVSVDDGLTTESWLGVPMIVRDRIAGVISVQSYRKNVFTPDDVLLVSSIANQAAVALENVNLYKDLEGLTYALEHRVQERTNELREANLRLMAADRSKNQFLANMSHELRTPLNSIIGFSTLLLESTRSVFSERRYQFLENIKIAGTHLLQLISDILDLSKIEAGKMELHPELFDVRDTLAAVERVMHGAAGQANVALSSEVAPDVPRVRLDEGRLRQILFNLLSNAIKFSPAGGPVSTRVQFLPAAQSILGSDSMRITVTDHGIGMAPEELRMIFDEFYQSEEARRATRGGTGLGLSLTRNFVELHHGTIDVQSSPGEGSSFTLLLPTDYEGSVVFTPRRHTPPIPIPLPPVG
jgi:signal transduction histidine kinase